MDGGGGSEKEEVPGGKAVSLRRSARVASNSRSASSVSSSVEGGGGASEGEGGKGEGDSRGVRGRGRGKGRSKGGPSSRSSSSSSAVVPSPSLPAPPPPAIISRREDEAIVYAAEDGNLAEVMRLYHEDNVSLDSTYTNGSSSLMIASDTGHFPVVQFLVSKKGEMMMVALLCIALLLVVTRGYCDT